ncbi:MAG: hypothetical protein FWF23_04930, partial [Alphaproteobacteria bacterium]|nr:hypothetical protein [Alphaproteobacteria bacterium]
AAVYNNKLYITNYSGICVVDLSTVPPSVLEPIDLGVRFMLYGAIVPYNNKLYIARYINTNNPLSVVDLSANPPVVSTMTDLGIESVYSMAAYNNKLYITSWFDELYVITLPPAP